MTVRSLNFNFSDVIFRYLASGFSFNTTASIYRVSITTVTLIVSDEFLPVPKAADWKKIAQGFERGEIYSLWGQ